jgi:hypothetical protein
MAVYKLVRLSTGQSKNPGYYYEKFSLQTHTKKKASNYLPEHHEDP